jgi:membrane complex biogenesis BtpA family protein
MKLKIFEKACCNVIGMIHVPALPGTPSALLGGMKHILEKVEHETELFNKHKVHGVIIENMHDTPYCLEKDLGPETAACMAVLANKVRSILPRNVPVGVQVLAAANRSALAVALAANLQFVRVEGFVYAHVADEGWINGCAGPLLRYRHQIAAPHIAVYADIKKKHSSHAITADVSIAETARAAQFFQADGVVVTGSSTGDPASAKDLHDVYAAVHNHLPVLIGSGVTPDNMAEYKKATGLIIGSYLKQGGLWQNDIDEDRLTHVMEEAAKYH